MNCRRIFHPFLHSGPRLTSALGELKLRAIQYLIRRRRRRRRPEYSWKNSFAVLSVVYALPFPFTDRIGAASETENFRTETDRLTALSFVAGCLWHGVLFKWVWTGGWRAASTPSFPPILLRWRDERWKHLICICCVSRRAAPFVIIVCEISPSGLYPTFCAATAAVVAAAYLACFGFGPSRASDLYVMNRIGVDAGSRADSVRPSASVGR